jgi:ADP-ribose pyrophosphatase YjhB (NUDIX family)
LKDALAKLRRLYDICQTGLHYTDGVYDRERYEEQKFLLETLIAQCTGKEAPFVANYFQGQEGYQTPKSDARGIVFNPEGKLLLIRDVDDGLWCPPGGWCDTSLSMKENAVKEVYEESGLRVKAGKLIALIDKYHDPESPPEPFQVYRGLVHCTTEDYTLNPGHEAYEAGWFAKNEMPPLSLLRCTPKQWQIIFDYYEHQANWTTQCD